MVKGQRGQRFFDKALAGAFRSMRMRSVALPGDGGPKITNALSAIPSTVENTFLGPKTTPAFIGQLNEWRSWRDEAWSNNEGLGRGRGVGSRAHERAVRPPRSPRPPRQPQHPTRAQIAAAYAKAIKDERARLVQQLHDDPRNKGRTISVSGRRKHGGSYAYQVTLTRADGRTLTFWVTSDYQVGL